MPATSGRVRMPANNRVHSSAALQTHGIWQSAIGYDPYAPNKEDNKKSGQPESSNVDPESENPYANFQGLLALARVTNFNADEARGSCKKCGRVGHLTFQCRNFLSSKEDKERDPEAFQAAFMSGLDKLKGNGVKMNGKRTANESEGEEESESSDSDYDLEIERAIAQKYGKNLSRKLKSSRKKSDESDWDDSDSGERKKRGRSKKRSINDSDEAEEGGRKRRKEKRRRKDETSDDDQEPLSRRRKSRKEKRRRRSRRHSDDSDVSEDSSRKHKRRSRRAASPSDSDASSSEDSRVGREKRRSKRRSRRK